MVHHTHKHPPHPPPIILETFICPTVYVQNVVEFSSKTLVVQNLKEQL